MNDMCQCKCHHETPRKPSNKKPETLDDRVWRLEKKMTALWSERVARMSRGPLGYQGGQPE